MDEPTERPLLYSELIHDFAPGKPVRIEFAVLKTKTKEVAIQRHSALVQQRQADHMKRVVERVWRAIDAEHFYPAPTPLACGGCRFGGRVGSGRGKRRSSDGRRAAGA